MKDKVKFMLVIALIISVCFSLGVYVVKPGTSIGMSTGYDKAAALTTLKTINGAVNEKTAYTDALTALVKQCLMLPDPIYGDLMWELKKTATEAVKVKDFKTMVGNYILVLEGKTIPKPPTPPSNSKKYVFEGSNTKNTDTFKITNKSFKIKWTLIPDKDFEGLLTIQLYKQDGRYPEQTFNAKNNDESKVYKEPGTYYLSIVPLFLKSWRIEVIDGE